MFNGWGLQRLKAFVELTGAKRADILMAHWSRVSIVSPGLYMAIGQK